MSRFKRIKNKTTKKSSVSIDEKITALNKELVKTGMLEEESPTNSTDGVYSTSTYVPPQQYIEADVPDSSGILGGGFTQSSAGSGVEGDAPNHSSVSDLFNDTVNATIFPSTEYEGKQGYGVVIGPSFGAGTSYGIIEGGNTYRQVLGGFLAGGTRGPGNYEAVYRGYLQTNENTPGFYSQEQIDQALENWQLAVQVHAILVKVGFDHTLFNVTWKAWRRPILFEDLSGSPSFNHPEKGLLYLTGFSMLGTRNRYAEQDARRETTTNPQRRGLEDEPIYPGPIENLFNLGKRAFEWLKEKAGEAFDSINPIDDIFNAAVSGLLPPDPNNNYAPDIAGSIADGEPRIYDDDDIPDDQKDKLIKNMDWSEIGTSIPITSTPNNYSDDNFYVNDDGKVTPHTPQSKKKYPPNTATHGDESAVKGDKQKFSDNPLAKAGEFKFELVVPEDGSEPYFDYEDHAYYNPNSKDKGEVPDFIRSALASVSQAQGNQLPGYPKGIKGDVVKKAKIPWSTAIKNNPNIKLSPAVKNNPNLTNWIEESYITEGVGLGLYEPEAMNVDLADMRKGIMPEYPKKPPAEMIDGYHEKSPLRPKPLEKEPYVKITKADLIRNHRIKPSEVDEMMDTINMVNAHIKAHPEDLIHAQMRYPKDDPRLAELNWKMDQMLDAGEEYLDKNFKENQTLYKRATDRTKKNIKLTDPKYVQRHYDELRGTTKPKKTKLVGRLGKHLNKYESKSFFKHVNSKDFRKTSQRILEKKKFLEKQEQKRLDYINDINAEMDEFRSDWRKDISESDFTNITTGNKIGQTFQHTSGATITLDATMGDTSMIPSQVTLDLGGDEKITVDAPSENEYGLTGVTKPLDKKVMQKQSVKTAKEINDQLDASEKASESKSARVPIETGDLGYKSTDEILDEVGDQWTYEEYMDQMNALSDRYAKIAEPLEKVKLDYIYNKHEDVPISIVDAIDAITKALHQAQEALHQAWERYNKVPDLPDDYNLDDNDLLDMVAAKGNVSTSKDMFDYYMDKFVDNPTDKSVNMNRIFKPHLNKLKGYLPDIEKLITVGQNSGDSLDKIQKDVNNYWDGSISPRMPLDLRNSLGNGSQVDVDKFLKTGNWQINKDFVFTEKDDFTGRDMGILGILPSWYARAKSIQKGTGGDLSPYVNVPMKYNITIPGSKKKKKVNESTAFSKIKKFRNKY